MDWIGWRVKLKMKKKFWPKRISLVFKFDLEIFNKGKKFKVIAFWGINNWIYVNSILGIKEIVNEQLYCFQKGIKTKPTFLLVVKSELIMSLLISVHLSIFRLLFENLFFNRFFVV